nr:hypothetical protein [Amycolatopsis sp. BJA-103]
MVATADDVPPAAANASSSPSLMSSSVKRLPALTQAAMWWTAILIAVLTAAVVTVLWWLATAGLTGADLVKVRLDALKVGLSIGVGGVVALYLAWRRQHSTEADLDNRERALAHQQDIAAATQAHQERVAEDARADAVERRITELYLKAVEQLGSAKAPVRLGGLYVLERLAQDNETQCQTIANDLRRSRGVQRGNFHQRRHIRQDDLRRRRRFPQGDLRRRRLVRRSDGERKACRPLRFRLRNQRGLWLSELAIRRNLEPIDFSGFPRLPESS